MSSKAVFIVGARRTAFGTFGGALKNHSATDLAEHAARAAIQAAAVKPEAVDHVVFGNVIQSSNDAAYLSRHVALRVGLPVSTPAVTINRLCGSGFQAVVDAVHQIRAGDSQVVVAGGTESMSQAPFVVRGTRFGTSLGKTIEFEDALWQGLTDQHIKLPMGLTAEKLGAQFKVTRKDSDEFALRSQTLWSLAQNAGYFKAEIAPISLKTRKGEVSFDKDEHPRETTAEQLAQLKPVFKKDGLVTAGNASGVSDGAAAVVVASEAAVKEHKLRPLARVVGYAAVGVDPTVMGRGPVDAIRKVLAQAQLKQSDVDIYDINEAFAAQAVAVQRELKLDLDRLNLNGGAIALGHPLAASGARITAHLSHELQRRGAKYAIGSACIGGGQGIAVLLERV